MTVATGHFAVLRRSFGAISDDQRMQAVIVAFCFGALLEALAGFGTPVAITSVMLIALGFQPIKAAALALVANTAPVAFGAIAIPIITLGETTGLPADDLGAMVGRQTPLLALIVPLILVGMVDGRCAACARPGRPRARRRVLRLRPVRLLELHLVELTDIVASLLRHRDRSSSSCAGGSRASHCSGEPRRPLRRTRSGRRLRARPGHGARDRPARGP